ncbi:MAG: glycine--tRNA ligase subunit beta [Burkholderiales bacterium]|nr:glycine--tRNA ligase subunit beta [Burkholderiales bacterium]
MERKNLLVELFVEELPPKSLKKLGESFSRNLAAALAARGLAGEDAKIAGFSSPRRLAVRIENVAEKAQDRQVSHKLMPTSVGLDAEGKPTPALLKRLAALGADAEAPLRRVQEGKAENLYLESVAQGMTLSAGLQESIAETLSKLPIAKRMSYQLEDGWESVSFVRPAHRLVALHGSAVVPVAILGLESGRITQGHRFEAKQSQIEIRDADSYESQLLDEGGVIPGFDARRAEIERQLRDAAEKIGGVKPIDDDALLDEVTALVERPNVLIGKFDREFLEVPQECLILTMKANQKYFPLLDDSGRLTEKFLIVSNIRPEDPSLVVGGNERVVRPRLSDAKFFYDQDRRKPLDSRIMGLSRVVYHNKLGSLGERVERVQSIARNIGNLLEGEELALLADRAALLSKADLLTDMVGEFPELQGIMGRYYALHDGLPEEVAHAIEDHYKPRFAGDELPANRVGIAVALADKLETLVGMFSIGQMPTGDKDPFALRRHALGIIRILIEKNLSIGIDQLFAATREAFPEPEKSSLENLAEFIYDRLSGLFREKGYTAQEVDAVLSLRPMNFADAEKRIAAVRYFASLPEAQALAAANKRVVNILKKAEASGEELDRNLFQEATEIELYLAMEHVGTYAEAAYVSGNYSPSLKALAALKEPVDSFFDHVMVNAEDPALRRNRLALLSSLALLMNRVADLSRLAS